MKPFLLILALCLAGSLAQAVEIPEGYVLQILEPTGGKIARPKDWLYFEQHHGPVYVWTLSREDLKKGPYQTGLKIQAFMGIKKGTGKSPKEFCLSFLDSKKKSTQVLTTFPEKEAGIFTREGIEVEESITEGSETKKYHIVYSAFWLDGSDLAVITIGGTPVELWPQFKKTFEVMSEFELIDMKRFENKSAPAISQ